LGISKVFEVGDTQGLLIEILLVCETVEVYFIYYFLCFYVKIYANFGRWFALIRIWAPWLAPRQGKNRFELDKEAVLCSFLSLTGKHLVLLAISGVDDVMTLFTSIDGAVNLRVCSP
jgi:hypothetical protein